MYAHNRLSLYGLHRHPLARRAVRVYDPVFVNFEKSTLTSI